MTVSRQFKEILIDRFESWELAEFLQIETEDFVDAFEDEIEDNLEDLVDLAGLRGEESEEEDD